MNGRQICPKHDQMLEEDHKTRIEAFCFKEVEVGNLILVNNCVAHKE
jgi:hypothetical protein